MQTALVTGATRGIGREVARRLVEDGVHVLVGGRDLERARAAAESMPGEAEPIELDVGSPESIAAFARGVTASLDILVNNAGVFHAPAEPVWAVNVRGPILLTRSLDGALAPDARIVNVTSGLGALSSQPPALQRKLQDAALTIDDLLALPPAEYGQSKAVLNAFTRLLAREWPGRIVTSANPGWVQTRMGGAGAPRRVEEGAESILFCCRLEPGPASGHVFKDGREVGF